MRHEPEPLTLFTDVENIPQHLVKIIWSGFYLALTFILVSYLDNFFTAFISWAIDYKSTFNLFYISRINGGMGYWSMNRVLVVYLTGPLLGLFIALVSFAISIGIRHSSSHIRLFIYWLMIAGFINFFSYFVSAFLFFGDYTSSFYSGLVVVFTWWWLSYGSIKIISIIACILVSLLPLVVGPLTLSFAHAGKLIEQKAGRKILFYNILILPFIVALIILLPLLFPLQLNFMLIRLLLYIVVFFWIFVWFMVVRNIGPQIKRGGVTHRSPRLLLILVLLLIILSLTALSYKLTFTP